MYPGCGRVEVLPGTVRVPYLPWWYTAPCSLLLYPRDDSFSSSLLLNPRERLIVSLSLSLWTREQAFLIKLLNVLKVVTFLLFRRREKEKREETLPAHRVASLSYWSLCCPSHIRSSVPIPRTRWEDRRILTDGTKQRMLFPGGKRSATQGKSNSRAQGSVIRQPAAVQR